MDAATAARIFHDWAFAEGLMPDGQTAVPSSTAVELAAVQPITDAGKQWLRSKQIQAVAFNSPRSEIVVFTKRASPATKRALKVLPKTVDDVSIQYRQGLQNAVGGCPTQPFGAPPFVVRTVGGNRHYACGSSVSVGNFRDAGTLGCLVRDGNGKLYGLSNNHVTGGCNFAGVGLPILAPGVCDVLPGSLPPFTIGFHHASLNMVAGSPDNVNALENFDAAVFSIENDQLVTSFQGTIYDTPSQTAPLVPGMEVEKVGRTTGHTTGVVIGQMHGAHGVTYATPLYGFSGVVNFDPVFTIVGKGDLFSDHGDSGSLIVTTDQNGNKLAVGIVVAGMSDGSAPGGKATMALPIQPILAKFGMTLAWGHNT